MVDYSKVPVDYMRGGVERYVEKGVPPGSFLVALFSNDLKETFFRADDENGARLCEWVRFAYNYLPHHAWGSPDAVEAWIEHGGLQGMGEENGGSNE